MSYYRGDYGGAYGRGVMRGDPGFFSFLGNIGKSLLGSIPGVGQVMEGITTIGGRGGQAIVPATSTLLKRTALSTLAGAGKMVAKHPVLTAAGAAGAAAGAGAMLARRGMVPAGQRGMHISKRTGALVRNRRMRVTNPRALRRAIRRCDGFSRLAMRVLRFTHPRKVRGRPTFKLRRRKRTA